jgi:hypothetical protein
MSDMYPYFEEETGFDKTSIGWLTRVSIEIEIEKKEKESLLERYGDNLVEIERILEASVVMAVDCFYRGTEKLFKAVKNNPTERVALNQHSNLKKLPNYNLVESNIIEYVRTYIEDELKLNHTDAYNYFNELYHSFEDKKYTKKQNTFIWLKGDIQKLYYGLIDAQILSNETPLDDFKMAFSGNYLTNIAKFKWVEPKQTIRAYLFLKLQLMGNISFDKTYAHIKIIERLCDINNGSTIFNRFKEGIYPRDAEIINSVVKNI